MTSPHRNPWKWLAVANTAALWIVFGILGARFVGRADRAIRAQIDDAQAGPAEEAARALDEIPLPGLDRDVAEDVARARVAAWLALFRERVLRDGAVPTPFELPPYWTEKVVLSPREDLSRVTARLRAAIADRRTFAEPDDDDGALDRAESLAIVTQYALGEVAFDDVKPSNTEARFQLGDVLYRERQFERAIDTWRPILDDKRVIRRLSELAALRRLAPKGLHVWDYELESLLGRDPAVEAEAAARIEGLFRHASAPPPQDVIERRGIPQDEISDPTEEPAIFFPEPAPIQEAVPAEHWVATDPEQVFLLTDHAQFRIEAPTDRPFSSAAGARFMLHSAYRGPIHARLYQVSGRETFDGLDEGTLVARRSELTLVHEWTTQFAPIWENSMGVGRWELEAPREGPGFYVLIADARYCPVYAVGKFVVSDVALVQQVASDRVLLFAVDRSTGTPVAGLPIEGTVSGRLVQAADPGEDPPVVEATFRGTTGEDGLFEWTVAPDWRPGYQYSVKSVTSPPSACSHVETTYSLDGKSKTLKALVYSDRPIYRPGDTVSFKALLRLFDAEGLHAYDGQEALFKFRTSQRVFVARTCATTELGTASGSFSLPVECELGSYTVRVNNGPSQPLFEVEEYRRPEFEIVLDRPEQVPAGSPVDVGIHLRYFTGTPVVNAPVTVTLDSAPVVGPANATADWFSVAPVGGKGAWRRIESRSLMTDATGRCVYRFTAEDGVAARYVVTARATEESRREVSMSSSIEATAEAREADRPASPPVVAEATHVTVRLDKPFYQVGETAKLVVESKDPVRHVLVTLATGRIRFRQVVALQQGVAEIPIEVHEEDVPNVEIVALAVRNDGLERATTRLLVSPENRFLTVEVETDRTEYRPGQTCRATVRVTDSKGRPVPECELSLGVVNEAIYALREDDTPDLREFFHRLLRPLTVEESFLIGESSRAFIVWKAPTFVKGMINCFEAMGVGGGGGGRYGGRFGGKEMVMKGGLALRPPRSDFRDTAYWNAHVKTDGEGVAAVSFRLPEGLTRFRFTARGITQDHKVGVVRQSTVVRMPFYVRLATPRVMQEGNTIALSGLIHNDTGRPQVVRCSFEGPFRVLRTTAPRALALGPGEVAQVQYLISIDRHLPEAAFTFGAACDEGPSDAVTIAVPGRRHGIPFQEGRSGSVTAPNPQEEVFTVPQEAIRGTLSLEIRVNAGLHGAILDALDPLIEYPYGCVEQTMSRFLPAVAAQRALGSAPHRWSEKLPLVVEAGLLRLYGFQHADGGWGWWEKDPTNDGMTAYVLYGLSLCRKAGVEVDRRVADRGAELLRKRLADVLSGSRSMEGRAPLSVPVDPAVYALLALAEYESTWGPSDDASRRLALSVVQRMKQPGPAEEVLLALACDRLGAKEEAERLAMRAGERPAADILTTAFLLQLESQRGGEVWGPVRFLLLKREGNGWRTTLESAYAILGLSSVLQGPAGEHLAPGRIRIDVGGVRQTEIALPDRIDPSFDGRIKIAEPPSGWGEKVVVRLSFSGEDTAFYAVSLQGMVGGEDPAAASRGMEVSREYFVKVGDQWRPVEAEVPVGGTVLVHLQVRSAVPQEYVMVTDPRADGFEPVDGVVAGAPVVQGRIEGLTDRVDLAEGWAERLVSFERTVRGGRSRESAWAISLLREVVERRRFAPQAQECVPAEPPIAAASVEHRDDRTLFFLTALPAGTSHLYYTVRAELPGRVHVLPPQATPMYEPEVHARGTESRLRVTDDSLVGSTARSLEAPPGVEGLLRVIDSLDRIDADEVIRLIPSRPRIGDLLVSVAGESGLWAWLSADAATQAAGGDLGKRIEAARRDLATRRLCADSLSAAPREWLPAIEEALGSNGLARKVFEGAATGDLEKIDSALLWATEDRAFRLALLTHAQRLRGTALVDARAFAPVSAGDIVRALGPKAPSGDALVRWKLSQRGEFPAGTLAGLATRIERDLELKIVATRDLRHPAASGRVSDLLDSVLGPAGLFYCVRDGVVRVGPLEDLVE